MGAANLVAVDFRKVWRLDVAAKIWRFCRARRIDIINTHGGRDSSLCLFAFWGGAPLVRSRHITAPIKRNRSYRKSCSHIIAAAAAIKDATDRARSRRRKNQRHRRRRGFGGI